MIKWFKKIVDTVMEENLEISTWKGKRTTLILCEDIRTAQDLKMFVVETEGWPEDKVHLYAHSNSKYLPSISKQLGPGEVIIATNLAGRGTDIKVTDAVNASGGLLCLMTFVARNRSGVASVWSDSSWRQAWLRTMHSQLFQNACSIVA